MNKSDLQYLLINTPLTDPTAPYHSISYLVGAAAGAGYSGFACLDANIAALTYLAQEPCVTALLDLAASVRATLEAQPRLTRLDQLSYRYALKAVGLAPDSVLRAIAVMRDPETFYDYSRYREAVMVLTRWMDLMSLAGVPGQFTGFTINGAGIANLNHVGDLTDAAGLRRIVGPFAAYFDGPFAAGLHSRSWHFVGLSVNYTAQLPFAMQMCKVIRAACPTAIIALGGTEITDTLKNMLDPQQIWSLFPDGDVIVAGEGETALVEILDAIYEGAPLPVGRPGILLPTMPLAPGVTEVRYEDLSTMPAPRYDIWDYDLYWAPEPFILYSPTRGCYWNKCTFCDYGLNTDMPTSPSRVRPIERALDDLRAITALSRTVYFSVDTMSPAYLKRITRAMQEHQIAIRWGAELRLERSFRKEMADELKNAGCVAISFGYESGSQRVLNLIDKGVRLDDVPQVLGELRRVGIGAQMMGFIGFPGETLDDAQATYDFLRANAGLWTLAGIGDFMLTPGSIVAKRYEQFGVRRVGGLRGDEIIRIMYWVDGEGRMQVPGSARHPVLTKLALDLIHFFEDRPFVGGIDTSHSLLYFARFGPDLVPPDVRARPVAQAIVAPAHYRTPLRGAAEFVKLADLKEYRLAAWRERRAVHTAEMLDWLGEYPAAAPADEPGGVDVLEIYTNGAYIAQTAAMAAHEQDGSAAYKLAVEMLLKARGLR